MADDFDVEAYLDASAAASSSTGGSNVREHSTFDTLTRVGMSFRYPHSDTSRKPSQAAPSKPEVAREEGAAERDRGREKDVDRERRHRSRSRERHRDDRGQRGDRDRDRDRDRRRETSRDRRDRDRGHRDHRDRDRDRDRRRESSRDREKRRGDDDGQRDREREKKRRSPSNSPEKTAEEKELEKAQKEKEKEEKRQKDEINDLTKDQRTVFVSQLVMKANERSIKEFFEKIGKVNDVIMIRDKYTNRHKGFAYVEMTDLDSVPVRTTSRDVFKGVCVRRLSFLTIRSTRPRVADGADAQRHRPRLPKVPHPGQGV
jgi:hypothetical protein